MDHSYGSSLWIIPVDHPYGSSLWIIPVDHPCGYSLLHNGLSSNKMARITSYCGAMRNREHQMALITSECPPRRLAPSLTWAPIYFFAPNNTAAGIAHSIAMFRAVGMTTVPQVWPAAATPRG